MASDRSNLRSYLDTLKAFTDPASVKAASIAIAAITEACLINPANHSVVENATDIVNQNVVKLLVNVISDTVANGPRPALNHAIRALADITLTQEGKKLFLSTNGLELLHKILNQHVTKTAPGDHGEEFSFAMQEIVFNVAENPQSLPLFISLNYPTILLRYMSASAGQRPGAALFAAYVLTKIASTDEGRQQVMKGELVSTIKNSFKVAINDQGTNREFVTLLEQCCKLISTICVTETYVPQFITNGFITPLVKVCTSKKQNKYQYPVSTIKAATAVLTAFVKNEVGADEVGQNTNIIILRNMLAYALTLDPKAEHSRLTITKICLAIGPLFGAEGSDVTVPAGSLIQLLNRACATYISLDNETSFITTSLLVHVGSFPDGAVGLKLKETIDTSARLLSILLEKEKAEDIQSIMRNVIIVLQGSVSQDYGGPGIEDQVHLFAEYKLFKLLENTLVLQNELNSEITENVLAVLVALSNSRAGLIEVKKLLPVIKNVHSFFTDENQGDERKETIVPLANQLIQAAV